LKGSPTVDEGKRRLLEDRLTRLRGEKVRLAERFRDQELLMQAVASAKSLAAQEYVKRVAAVEARAGEQARKRDLLNDSRPYGTLPSKSVGTPAGSGASGLSGNCSGCGLEFSFGSYGITK
jgi:hypothetical protein